MMQWGKASQAHWALTQGVLGGRTHQSLSPSAVALSPHSYLGSTDFLRMMGIAFVAHVVTLLILASWPREKVEQIPVQALSFRLGEAAVLAPPTPVMVEEETAPVQPQDTASEPLKKEVPKPAPKPKKIEIPETLPEVARQVPQENVFGNTLTLPPRLMPAEQLDGEAADKKSLLERSPKQYVRQYGLPSVENLLRDPTAPKPTVKELTEVAPTVFQGVNIAAQQAAEAANVKVVQGGGQGTEATEIIRQRYEQQISAWIARHKVYPASAAGKEGRAVVRMRIDRQGYVRYYALEETSTLEVLDKAALDMIRRANPVPRPPANYPAGNLIEFLIPITFETPR